MIADMNAIFAWYFAPLFKGRFEEDCPGHVASKEDPKVCARCGVHIDSLRPDDD